FSGFIAIPLVLFIFHNFGKNLYVVNKYSYSLILIIWILSTQDFYNYILFTGVIPRQNITLLLVVKKSFVINNFEDM